MLELDNYIKTMEYKGITEWKIAWESLPIYIGHKLFNIETLEVVTVNWDNGYPEYIMKNGKRSPFCCDDFRHNKAVWEYHIGELY